MCCCEGNFSVFIFTEGLDYEVLSTDLSYEPGSRMACASVTIIDDDIISEPIECFNVIATDPVEPTITVVADTTTVCIIDTGMYHMIPKHAIVAE